MAGERDMWYQVLLGSRHLEYIGFSLSVTDSLWERDLAQWRVPHTNSRISCSARGGDNLTGFDAAEDAEHTERDGEYRSESDERQREGPEIGLPRGRSADQLIEY